MKLVKVRSYIILVLLLACFGTVNAKMVPRLYNIKDNTLIIANPIRKNDKGKVHSWILDPVAVSLIDINVIENKSKKIPMRAKTLY